MVIVSAGTPIIIMFCCCIVISIVTPKIIRKAQIIKRKCILISKKFKHKKFIKTIKKVKYQEVDCIICLEDYSENNQCAELYCKHKFHHSCIKEWMICREVCPLCNTELNKKKFFKK